jgi:hypothetical protein
VTDDPTRAFIADCQGMSEDEIIAAYHADYYDDAKPHVRKAFAQLGIEAHEVSAGVQRHIKSRRVCSGSLEGAGAAGF